MQEIKTIAEEKFSCSLCGQSIVDTQYHHVGENVICSDCMQHGYDTCEYCHTLISADHCFGDENHTLCRACYENYYTRCENCDCLIHEDDAYESDEYYYCHECYQELTDYIHDYNYKPEPIFYGNGRFFGVELEIDRGGRDRDHAKSILQLGNSSAPCIYIKSDGSLNDGMEIVTHPMSLAHHMSYCWDNILNHCTDLGYYSHQTTTCGLHVHINRESLGDDQQQQEETISRILYFVEHHWDELLLFSRRTEATMERWAARYGYESTPKKLLDKAKERYGRYSAVNLCNRHTIEFRIFRGTLKLNTLIATLQMVNRICNVAFSLSDEEIQKLSWSDFISEITEPELIQYLKERKLYAQNQNTPKKEEV